MQKIVDFYEVKTKLFETLRRVQRRESFTVTNRSETVADLLPNGNVVRQNTADAIGNILKINKTIAPVSDDVLEEYRKEGRR